MPSLFRKRSKSRIRPKAKPAKEYRGKAKNVDENQHEKNNGRSRSRAGRFVERDDPDRKKEAKRNTGKRKSKTLEKIKSVFRKEKKKLCKKCKCTGVCRCKLDTVEKSLLKDHLNNVNQSALGNDLLPVFCRLRSSSSTTVSEITGFDVTAMCPVNKDFPEKYHKYIPVRKIWGPLYPRSLVEDFKMVWLDMQIWYSRYYDQQVKQKRASDLNTSKSESSLTESPTKNSSTLSEESHVIKTVDHQREQRQKRAMLKQRFRLRGNAEYIAMVSWQRFYTPLDCQMHLFVSSDDDGDLVHLKTMMLVTCMRSFVQTDGDFQVLWVADMRKILPVHHDLTTCEFINPEVALELAVNLSRVKAVLFISQAASILLRHQDIGFLDTLAVTADIKRSDIIVLPLSLNPSEIPSSMLPEPNPPVQEAPDPLF